MPDLRANMQESWSARAAKAIALVSAAEIAPGLFKPEAIAEAVEDYHHAIAEMDRWSA